jgi:hypothetical protein
VVACRSCGTLEVYSGVVTAAAVDGGAAVARLARALFRAALFKAGLLRVGRAGRRKRVAGRLVGLKNGHRLDDGDRRVSPVRPDPAPGRHGHPIFAHPVVVLGRSTAGDGRRHGFTGLPELGVGGQHGGGCGVAAQVRHLALNLLKGRVHRLRVGLLRRGRGRGGRGHSITEGGANTGRLRGGRGRWSRRGPFLGVVQAAVESVLGGKMGKRLESVLANFFVKFFNH